jgi:hydroxypyruvate reductase
LAGLVREIQKYKAPFKPPVALISGGECTVTLRAEGGRGGRCSEFLLSLGLEAEGVWAVAADTDGIDGSEDNAGALLTPETAERARTRDLDPRQFLARHDSYGFFSALGDLMMTGPTRTNVNDYRAVLVL